MIKSKIFDYTYMADKTGYYIFYKRELISGLSLNVSLMKKPIDIEYVEYHRLQAQKQILKLINNENKS